MCVAEKRKKENCFPLEGVVFFARRGYFIASVNGM